MRMRRICATRSGSQSTSIGSAPRRSSSSDPCLASAGANSAVTWPASAPMSVASGRSSSEPASSFERSSRSVASLPNRATCSRTTPTNSRRVSSSSSSSSSSSRKPPSEKIGVRSSCEAVAMKRRRAVSTCASWRCMSSSARASWPSSSSLSAGKTAVKSPPATRSAPCSRIFTRRAIARETRKPPVSASSRPSVPAMRIWLRISETLPCTSDSGAENTTTRLTTPSSRIGSATCPSSTSPRYSVPRASRPVRAATSATWKRRSSICTSIVESENGAPSCRPSVPPPTVNSVTRVLVASSMRRDEAVDLARRAVVEHEHADLRREVARGARDRAQLLLGQRGLELRRDVEEDRGHRDERHREEQHRQPRAQRAGVGRAPGESSTPRRVIISAPCRGSGSRRRAP